MGRLGVASLLSLAVAAWAGCAGSATGVRQLPPDAVAAGVRSFPEGTFRWVDSNSGLHERGQWVLRDAGQWAALWERVVGNVSPRPPVPAVDFGRDMVVAAAMGSRPTGGYGIAIDSAYHASDGIYVVVRELSPGSDCMVTMAFTAPFTAVLLPRSSEPVYFVERQEVRSCS